MKKLLVIMLLVFLIPASLVEAKDNEFKRQIDLDLTSPIENSNSNAKLYWSLGESFGGGLNYLNKKYGLDNSGWGRTGQTVLILPVIVISGWLSHELAHARELRKVNPQFKWSIDWSTWNPYPKFQSTLTVVTPLQEAIAASAGLNQEEQDALIVYQNTIVRMSWDQAVSFIVRKLSAPLYDVYSGMAIDLNDGDLSKYVEDLNLLGIGISKSDIYCQATLSALLSYKSWESFFATYRYLARGQRVSESKLIHFSNGLKLSLPLVQYIMTENGGYYNFHSTLITGKRNIDFSLGTDLDFLFPGKVNNLRLGGKIHNLFFLGPVDFSLSGYLDLKRSDLSYSGSYAGLGVDYKITKQFSLTGEIAHNSNDLVKKSEGHDNGPIFYLGLRYQFKP
jgi:hypothetical protein